MRFEAREAVLCVEHLVKPGLYHVHWYSSHLERFDVYAIIPKVQSP